MYEVSQGECVTPHKLNACKSIERLGYPVTYLSPNKYGMIDSESLKKHITDKTKLVSVMFANNEIGTIEPIAELAEITHTHGAVFHTDAVQAVGHVKIDVNELGIDMLSASAHKFNGPKGIGFLYIRNGTNIAKFNDGGSQEFDMRAGTENIAAIVGMAKALSTNCNLLAENAKHITEIEQIILNKLNAVDLEFLRNGSKNHIPGNISLSFKNADGEALLHRLDLLGICVSTGSACDSVNTRVSHVLRAVGLEEIYAKGTIRISLGKDNTAEDANAIADSLIKILNR